MELILSNFSSIKAGLLYKEKIALGKEIIYHTEKIAGVHPICSFTILQYSDPKLLLLEVSIHG